MLAKRWRENSHVKVEEERQQTTPENMNTRMSGVVAVVLFVRCRSISALLRKLHRPYDDSATIARHRKQPPFPPSQIEHQF